MVFGSLWIPPLFLSHFSFRNVRKVWAHHLAQDPDLVRALQNHNPDLFHKWVPQWRLEIKFLKTNKIYQTGKTRSNPCTSKASKLVELKWKVYVPVIVQNPWLETGQNPWLFWITANAAQAPTVFKGNGRQIKKNLTDLILAANSDILPSLFGTKFDHGHC